jgi:hypothetical protein
MVVDTLLCLTKCWTWSNHYRKAGSVTGVCRRGGLVQIHVCWPNNYQQPNQTQQDSLVPTQQAHALLMLCCYAVSLQVPSGLIVSICSGQTCSSGGKGVVACMLQASQWGLLAVVMHAVLPHGVTAGPFCRSARSAAAQSYCTHCIRTCRCS